jgi:hypothetical protein
MDVSQTGVSLDSDESWIQRRRANRTLRRIAQSKLQGGVSKLRALNRKTAYHRGNVDDRKFPAVQGCILGNIAPRKAAAVVGDATIVAGEMTNLAFPIHGIGRKFVDEDDPIAAPLSSKYNFAPSASTSGIALSPRLQLLLWNEESDNEVSCNQSTLGRVILDCVRQSPIRGN